MNEAIITSFREKFPYDKETGQIGHRHDGDCEWSCVKYRKMEEFILSAISEAEKRWREEGLKEAIREIEKGKIDMDNPKNLLVQIVYEEMLVEDVPKVFNDMLEKVREAIESKIKKE